MQRLICATGHRPNKLGGYGLEVRRRLTQLAVGYLERTQPEGIISGMALGWDQAWAEAGLLLGLPVHAAIPFAGQGSQWPAESRRAFDAIVRRCASVTIVSPGSYSAHKMQIRNEWMVDRAVRVCALWNGTPGGTANCLNYRGDWQRPVDNLWPRWLELTQPSPMCNDAAITDTST